MCGFDVFLSCQILFIYLCICLLVFFTFSWQSAAVHKVYKVPLFNTPTLSVIIQSPFKLNKSPSVMFIQRCISVIRTDASRALI